MDEASLSPAEAARILSISEGEAIDLARPDGRIPLEAVRDRVGATAVARELARAREEVGRLAGQLKESVEERRQLTEEVLELRAAAEERLMLMERIEHIARIEKNLAETEAELERLRTRGILARLLNRH